MKVLILRVSNESIQIVGVVRHMLARVIAMAFCEIGYLRLFLSIDTFNKSNTKVAVIDTPNFHATVGIPRAGIINTLNKGSTLDFNMEPGPFFNCAGRTGIRLLVAAVAPHS